MIHYHGTPIGGTRQDAARFLAGRHALVPFPRQDDVAIVAEVCQSFCFDNGAFSVWKKGGTLDVESYLRWVDDWRRHPGFDWALIPDVIDGDEADNDRLLEQWPEHLPDVPVWHLHESIERLVRLASNWKTVAFGSSGQWRSPGTAAWWKRMAAAMDAICNDQGRPMCRLHGLRMLDPAIFTRLPFASADSTNAAVNGGSISRFGMYAPPTAGQRASVIADRIEAHTSAPIWQRENQIEMAL
ncbi:hypothetical protein N0375_08025 [Pseudomonas aeruginosa]|uniref:hypothetical protein n=1 Tax=Pseudomonas aeruginosa TaxID=287 RepID=UPI0003B96297|nr:hypothetical protein [Pseudomonas aeruginosa]ELL0594059.1 hypothetical protein [Pseudomonas aeruginosa]ELY1879133.1 hypothetical protein [Pseudomonas aeruginosa]ERY71392.1 hypothetical protein Q055_02177 [Pseudomonas aeruginosa BL01]MBU5936857.1 hypothetical protein [Pseudomonas aeruginosa]MCO3038338.1 hypothetical protein [Pseudomonas aeruginosa]